MFCFESFNGRLKAYGKDSSNVINQIIEKTVIRSLETSNSTAIRKYLYNKLISQTETYATYHKGSLVYTSRNYKKATKTIDYFVSFLDGSLGKIKFYFECSNTYFAKIEEFKIDKQIDQVMEVQPLNKVIEKPVDEISHKFIFMQFGLKQMIVKRPNPFEVN